MSTQGPTGAVHKTVIVRCDVERAFRVWTEQIDLWWPKSHSRSGDPNTTVIFEAQIGGRLYERTSQGTEHDWGEITAWEPPHRLAYTWYLGSGPTKPTHVEVRFSSETPSSTRVDVTHRGPEWIGELWLRNSARYDASWNAVLEGYISFVTN
jgi:uncharacterized protein YndB with AHSA1/START domain